MPEEKRGKGQKGREKGDRDKAEGPAVLTPADRQNPDIEQEEDPVGPADVGHCQIHPHAIFQGHGHKEQQEIGNPFPDCNASKKCIHDRPYRMATVAKGKPGLIFFGRGWWGSRHFKDGLVGRFTIHPEGKWIGGFARIDREVRKGDLNAFDIKACFDLRHDAVFQF